VALSIGISIGRHAAGIVVAEIGGGKTRIAWSHQAPRAGGQSASKALEDVLRQLPDTFRGLSVSLVLSPGDLACSDVVDLSPGVTHRSLPRLGPALCEARCAGESMEDLSADLVPAGSQVHAVAMRTRAVEELRAVVIGRGLSLKLVTAAPIAMGYAFRDGPLDITAAGERCQLERIGDSLTWRSFPVDVVEDQVLKGALSLNGDPIPAGQAAAIAVILADPDEVPNLLCGLPGAPRSFGARCRNAFLALGVTAILLLGALAFQFDRESRINASDLNQVRQAENRLWAKYLPGRAPREGELLRAMKRHLAETGAQSSEAGPLSVLTLWAEIAKQLPDVDELGVTLETLDLSPEEGRFTFRVPAPADDPMRNAALIEERLNKSDKIRARGDYEVKDKEVVVRLRVENKAAGEKK
jgi:hypothetical protein